MLLRLWFFVIWIEKNLPLFRFRKTFRRSRRWQCTSMAPYIVLLHVQYEIDTKVPVVKKTSEKLPDAMACSVGVVLPQTQNFHCIIQHEGDSLRGVRLMHETDDAGGGGGGFKTRYEWASEFVLLSSLLNGNWNIYEAYIEWILWELAVPSAVEVGL